MEPTTTPGEDFAYMEESRVDSTTTRDYPFILLIGAPVLTFAPANTDNREYANAARVGLMALAAAKPENATDEQEKAYELQQRLLYVQLFAAHCARGWKVAPVARVEERWINAKGEPVAEGTEGATKQRVMHRMPTYSPDAVRRFLEGVATRAPNVWEPFFQWIRSMLTWSKLNFDVVEVTLGNSDGG